MNYSFLEFCLLFSTPYFLIAITLLGFLFVDRIIFLNVFNLSILGAILNVGLKSIWQIPLFPSDVHSWFAYPSGHTQFAILFYMAVAMQFKKLRLYIISILILIPTLISIVIAGYHDWIEIIGGVFSGLAISFIFKAIIDSREKSHILFSQIVLWIGLPLGIFLSYYLFVLEIKKDSALNIACLYFVLSALYFDCTAWRFNKYGNVAFLSVVILSAFGIRALSFSRDYHELKIALVGLVYGLFFFGLLPYVIQKFKALQPRQID